MERRRSSAASIVLTAVLMAGACSCAPSDKPGPSPTPVTPITLRIGTDDEPDRPATDQINHFAAEVKRISNDQLVIEPVWHAAGDQDNWDQAVAQLVVAGTLDMGMIPARAWDTEGVTTLRALQAPFLITSNDLAGKVVTAEVANQMLAGLGKADITGLALVPESLREIFSFGKPFLTVRDFKGATIRVPRSDTSSKVFKALGATADDLVDPNGTSSIKPSPTEPSPPPNPRIASLPFPHRPQPPLISSRTPRSTLWSLIEPGSVNSVKGNRTYCAKPPSKHATGVSK